jgi:hypothetical protein
MRSKPGWAVAAVLGFGVVASVLAINVLSIRKAPAPQSLAPWTEYLQVVDDALKTGEVSAAINTWHLVYAAALEDQGWEGLIAVGDARLRIERAARSHQHGQAQARQIYLTALARAQRLGSVEGAVRAAAAFAALGDREVAAQAVHIAASLEARRPSPDPSASPLM